MNLAYPGDAHVSMKSFEVEIRLYVFKKMREEHIFLPLIPRSHNQEKVIGEGLAKGA